MQNAIYNHAEYRNCIKIGEFAKLNTFIDRHGKVAAKSGTLMGEKLVFKALKKMSILNADNYPYQQYLKHFKMMAKAYQHGEIKYEKYHPLVTPEGQNFLKNKLEEFLQNA